MDDSFYNPYEISEIYDMTDELKGFLIAEEQYSSQKHARANMNLRRDLPENQNLEIDPKNDIPYGINNQFISNVSFSISQAGYKVALLRLSDANQERYSIPSHTANKQGVSDMMRLGMLGLQVYDSPFSFSYTDSLDINNVFVHTNQSSLVFADKYIQLDLQLPSQRLYGLGERVKEFPLTEGTWTMWAKDNKGQYDDGTGGLQGYGVHPFLLCRTKVGDFIGIYFRNSNAQSPLIKFKEDGGSTLSYITTGGQIEIYFHMHGSAKQIIKSYQGMVGKPYWPPFWALGWNQASEEYNSQEDVEDMIASYEEEDIPLENVWLSSQYMINKTDFTVDKEKFPNLLDLSHQLHDYRRQFVVIINAPIATDNSQLGIFEEALQNEILILSNNTGDPLLQEDSQNSFVFIDWTHENATKVWSKGLMDLFEQVEYDGLWLDMNEVTGICDGECDNEQVLENLFELDELNEDTQQWYKTFNKDFESTYFMPFIPGFENQGFLDNMTLSLNSTHSNGEIEYNMHNLYGIMMKMATQDFLTKNETYPYHYQRAFIISRSTFAGSGRYGSHWLGDNYRDWAYMKYSIAGIMNFNMFGIPHVGADVCGFRGDVKDDEMCGRWIQLATFYPFARHHQSIDAPSSLPYKLDPYWKSVARASIYDRYQYLRLMYTCLFEVTSYGGTCFDPLFFHYPYDENTYENTEESFIVADVLKVSPILQPGITKTYTSYFPKGKWVSMTDFSDVIEGGKRIELQNQTTVNVHLREGKMMSFQDNSDQQINSTSQLIETPISIIAHRNINGTATGTLLLEKGRSKREMNEHQYEYYAHSLQQKTFIQELKKGTHGSQNALFKELIIVDAEDLATTDFACIYDPHINVKNLSVQYDEQQKSLRIWSKEQLQFHQFRQINFGSHESRDLNLCGPNSYHYRLRDGKQPDLSKSVESFIIDHEANTLPSLNVTLSIISGNTLNIKWTFEKTPTSWHDPFEVPEYIVNVNRQERPYSKLSSYVTLRDNPVEIHALTGSGEFVYSIHQMLLAKHLNVISVGLQTTRGDEFTGIFGLGQRVSTDFFYDQDGVYSLWATGDRMPKEDGRPPGKQGYGTHPFYMFKHSENNWVGVYQNLAAAQDYYIKNNKETGKVNVTLFAAGGLQDVFIIVDSSPENVVNGYYDIIGRPVLTPLWILGWHQCRWGYKNLQDIKYEVGNYTENELPLDGQWSDIDYLFENRDFEYDPVNYEGLPEFVDELRKNNKHWIPIIDGGIAAREWQNYETYTSGKEKDLFIKINDHEDFIGQQLVNDAVFPDWFHPEANSWWQGQIQKLYDQVKFDGLWLDQNEAANSCQGVCYQYQKVDEPIKNNIKYIPNGRDLEYKSLPLDAYHANGYREIDTHSLFGVMEVIATNGFFIKNNKRPVIISRSTFAGSGKYGSNLIGDDSPNTYYLSQSVPAIMSMNLFGIPLTGSELCGFTSVANSELCARWYMVAAFQPLSRNHKRHHTSPQAPYTFIDEYYEDGISYTDIMRRAMRVKYSIMKYYYSQLFIHSQFGGSPVYKPLFFEYPNDVDAYKNITQNVMLGDSLKISVLSDKIGVNQSDFYFPQGNWCNLFDKTEQCNYSNGEIQSRRTKAYDFYVHIKEGKIVPFQDVLATNVLSVEDLQHRPVDLHINGKANVISQDTWIASGTYINDDGVTLELKGNYNRYDVVATGRNQGDTTQAYIMFSVKKAENYDPKDDTDCSAINQSDYLGEIHLHNAKALKITNAFYTTATFVNQTETILDHSFYDASADRLIVKQAEIPLCLPSLTKITLTNYD